MENTNEDSYETPNAPGHDYVHLYEVPTGIYDYADSQTVPDDPKPPDPPPARTGTTPVKLPTAQVKDVKAVSGNKVEASDIRSSSKNPFCKGKAGLVILIVAMVVVVIIIVIVGVVCGTTGSCKEEDTNKSNKQRRDPFRPHEERQRKRVDGGWSSWSAWTACSATCGIGRSERSRSCDHPAPRHNGLQCVGGSLETKMCSRKLCKGRQEGSAYPVPSHNIQKARKPFYPVESKGAG